MPTFSLSEKTWWSLALGVVACSGPGSSDRSGPPATSTVVTTSPRATSVELACDGVRRTVSAEELTDRERARALLTELARALDRDPRPGLLDLKNHRRVEPVPGKRVAIDRALAGLEALDLSGPAPVFDVPFDTLAPPPLPAVDVTKTLSAFETTFTIGDSGALRRRNIRAAALRLDGTLILPGATFSFNDVVGSRTKERGFVFAPEIHGDVVSGGVGGGTCQVSSTLFDAALFGALDIVERKSHSRPSTYVKLGLDATVSYPSVDLKLKNPFGFALMIHAYLPRANTLRIELLGAEPVARVTHSLTAGSASDYARLVEPKSWLEPGEQRLRQRGAPGYEVTSVVAIAWPDGRTEERTYFSGYRPTPEILWVSSR